MGTGSEVFGHRIVIMALWQIEEMLATAPCVIIYLISLWTAIYNMATTFTFLAILLLLLVGVGMLTEWIVSSTTQIFAWLQYPALVKDFAMIVKFAAW